MREAVVSEVEIEDKVAEARVADVTSTAVVVEEASINK
jgi:hypothetical protein